MSPSNFNALGCLDQILWKGAGTPPVLKEIKKPSAYRVKPFWRYSTKTPQGANLNLPLPPPQSTKRIKGDFLLSNFEIQLRLTLKVQSFFFNRH